MARRAVMAKYQRTRSGVATERSAKSGPGDSVIFGSRESAKGIGVMAGLFGIVLAGIFFAMYRGDGDTIWPATGFVLIFGALLGMVVGQMAFVHPYRQLVIPALAMMFFGVLLWVMAFMMPVDWALTRGNYLALVGLLFVCGFVGYWLGYVFYRRTVGESRRFQERHHARIEDQDQPEA